MNDLKSLQLGEVSALVDEDKQVALGDEEKQDVAAALVDEDKQVVLNQSEGNKRQHGVIKRGQKVLVPIRKAKEVEQSDCGQYQSYCRNG